jgi:hypothetical protein
MSNDKHGPDKGDELYTFPAWHNMVPPIFFFVIGPVVTVLAIGGVWYYFSPKFTDVGYMPEQPVPYSHKLHAGDLKIDCRYCHTGVEKTAKAGVPPTQTCMNCHQAVKTDSPHLKLVRESWNNGKEGGKPIPWVRIHKVADYAYFDHSAHIQVGIGCESCHGRIDRMVEVSQVEPLSMGWCLDCHNNPKPHLRPKDKVTVMGYVHKETDKVAQNPNPPIHCSGCHR